MITELIERELDRHDGQLANAEAALRITAKIGEDSAAEMAMVALVTVWGSILDHACQEAYTAGQVEALEKGFVFEPVVKHAYQLGYSAGADSIT